MRYKSFKNVSRITEIILRFLDLYRVCIIIPVDGRVLSVATVSCSCKYHNMSLSVYVFKKALEQQCRKSKHKIYNIIPFLFLISSF